MKLAKLFFMVIMSARVQQKSHLPHRQWGVNWHNPSEKQFSSAHEEPETVILSDPVGQPLPGSVLRSSVDWAGLPIQGR